MPTLIEELRRHPLRQGREAPVGLGLDGAGKNTLPAWRVRRFLPYTPCRDFSENLGLTLDTANSIYTGSRLFGCVIHNVIK